MPKKGRRRGAKSGPGSKRGRNEAAPEYASDDEKLYGDFDDPDSGARSFMYDDIDEFHAGREKVLLDEGYQHQAEDDPSDEEVLGLDPEESDDEEIRNIKAQLRRIQRVQGKKALANDLEDEDDEEGEEEEEKGLPDSRAWGVKRNKYYGDDDIELKDLEDDEAGAVLEEKEALKLQRQMAEQLDEQDFGLDIFKAPEEPKESIEKEEKIVKDLSKLSQREKLKLLKKDSPELITLIDDFKQKMSEIQEKLLPIKSLIEKQQFKGTAADYIRSKYKLNLNYCINILFYLMLKAKQATVHNHPVIKRLLQYRSIMKELEPVDDQLESEIGDILDKLNSGQEVKLGPVTEAPRTFVRRKKEAKRKSPVKEDVALADSGSEGTESDDLYEEFGKPKKIKKTKASAQFETEEEKAALEFYASMKRNKASGTDEEEDSDDVNVDEDNTAAGGDGMDMDYYEDEEGDGKRAITYQIEKNKGLTARKKKELRNPRVKHRMKFRKAKIRRTGQFRTPRTEMQKYGGEISGIRLGVKRGVKLH